MLGYLRGTRVGAAVYNLGHSYPLPAAMSLAGAVWHHPLTLALGLLWLAHIGMDRLARYGLKYDVSFQHTHLGGPGPSGPGDARLPDVRPSGPPGRARSAGPVRGRCRPARREARPRRR
jgi:hypothetical protein